MRFGGHAVDALLFECHASHEAVIAQLGKEPIVIPAAVPETHEAAVEGYQRDNGDVEQLFIGFPPALGMQVVKQVRASGVIEEGRALFGQMVLLDREEHHVRRRIRSDLGNAGQKHLPAAFVCRK